MKEENDDKYKEDDKREDDEIMANILKELPYKTNSPDSEAPLQCYKERKTTTEKVPLNPKLASSSTTSIGRRSISCEGLKPACVATKARMEVKQPELSLTIDRAELRCETSFKSAAISKAAIRRTMLSRYGGGSAG